MAIRVDLEPSRVASPCRWTAGRTARTRCASCSAGLRLRLPGGRDEQTSLRRELRALLDRLASQLARDELARRADRGGVPGRAARRRCSSRCAQRGRLLRRDAARATPDRPQPDLHRRSHRRALELRPGCPPEVLALRYTRSNLAALVRRAAAAFAALAAERDIGYACERTRGALGRDRSGQDRGRDRSA